MNELLEYLSAALPYRVKVQINIAGNNVIGELKELSQDGKFTVDVGGIKCQGNLSEIKPYLRPMGDMKEDEAIEYRDFKIDISDKIKPWKCHNFICWLLKHHFDFLDLISESLAIKVTNEYE